MLLFPIIIVSGKHSCNELIYAFLHQAAVKAVTPDSFVCSEFFAIVVISWSVVGFRCCTLLWAPCLFGVCASRIFKSLFLVIFVVKIAGVVV